MSHCGIPRDKEAVHLHADIGNFLTVHSYLGHKKRAHMGDPIWTILHPEVSHNSLGANLHALPQRQYYIPLQKHRRTRFILNTIQSQTSFETNRDRSLSTEPPVGVSDKRLVYHSWLGKKVREYAGITRQQVWGAVNK